MNNMTLINYLMVFKMKKSDIKYVKKNYVFDFFTEYLKNVTKNFFLKCLILYSKEFFT